VVTERGGGWICSSSRGRQAAKRLGASQSAAWRKGSQPLGTRCDHCTQHTPPEIIHVRPLRRSARTMHDEWRRETGANRNGRFVWFFVGFWISAIKIDNLSLTVTTDCSISIVLTVSVFHPPTSFLGLFGLSGPLASASALG
jgi:hypothetical protein